MVSTTGAGIVKEILASYSPIEDIDPEQIQRLLDRGIHRYAIAREYRCTNVAINKYIKTHNLIEPIIEKIIFKK